LTPVADLGAIYLVSALILGAVFTFYSVRVLRSESAQHAIGLFSWSITYIVLLFGAMAVDVLIRNGL